MDEGSNKADSCRAGVPAPFNAPVGGGGPGRFRLPGPLADFSAMPDSRASLFDLIGAHPWSPAARTCPVTGGFPGVPKVTTASGSPTPSKGPLVVSRGQVTFDAEGNEIAGSPYFSRKVTWPGNAESGVTIGRGYDMGNRTKEQVKADLIAAKMPADAASKFAEGAGKKGQAAKKFVEDTRETLGEMSLEVQNQLFENIYPTYEERARANYDKWTTDPHGKALAGKVDWDKLDPAIRDVLVDFVYQGFTKGPKPMSHGMKDDPDELIEYIKTSMSRYEAGRHRADYLEKARKAKQAKAVKPIP